MTMKLTLIVLGAIVAVGLMYWLGKAAEGEGGKASES